MAVRTDLQMACFTLGVGFLLTGCNSVPSTFDAKGPGALEIEWGWWLMLGLSAAVLVTVSLVLLIGLFRPRPIEFERIETKPQTDNWFLFAVSAILPLIALTVVYFFAIRDMQALAVPTPDDSYVIEVTGCQWWWDDAYPNQEIVTANEIRLPVERRVELKVTAEDAALSFWLPELHSKNDIIPGQTHVFWLAVPSPKY